MRKDGRITKVTLSGSMWKYKATFVGFEKSRFWADFGHCFSLVGATLIEENRRRQQQRKKVYFLVQIVKGR